MIPHLSQEARGLRDEQDSTYTRIFPNTRSSSVLVLTRLSWSGHRFTDQQARHLRAHYAAVFPTAFQEFYPLE